MGLGRGAEVWVRNKCFRLLEMSAGYIQLAALGQQDAYLTGSPQVTYFSGVYKRHTPFVLEAYDIPFQNQQVVYGQENICRIPPKGDLIRALTLKVDLPPLYNPGNFWAWPTTASAATDPHIIINGTYFSLPYSGVTYYSTYNFGSWVSTNLGNFFSYSNALNQFVYSNCSTLEVDPNGGIFWGLDPKLGTPSKVNSSNLVYTVGTFSNGFANSASNTYSNSYSGGTLGSNFTLQQAGWIQSTGLPSVNTRTSLFLSLTGNQTYIITPVQGITQSYINFSSWTNQDTVSTYAVTVNGRLKFVNTGYYVIRSGITLGTGSIVNMSVGSNQLENIQGGPPPVPIFDFSCDFRVSPDPSMPIVMPLIVTSSANTYYVYANTISTVTQFTANTYFSVTPVDDLYLLNNNVTITPGNNIVPFYGNVPSLGQWGAPLNSTVTLNPDSSITFNQLGVWTISGVIYLQQSVTPVYLSNISVWHAGASTPDYSYTSLSTVGRDPTFAFTLPITVTSLTQKYYVNVYSNTTNFVMTNNTYFIVTQVSSSSYQGYETVLSNNGLTLTPTTQTQTLNRPLNFNNFSNTGQYSNIININYATGNLQFTNVATYMLTAVLSTADNVTSISFGTSSYQFTFRGLFPQYTVNVPYRVTAPNADVPITIGTDGNQNTLYSNTYISVHPVASNVIPTVSYNYYDSVGTWLVNRADLVIGGQTIQTLTGEFIEIYNDLYVPYENQPGLKLLVGKYDTATQIYPPGRTYFVNLPFYFYQNPGLAIPLAALGRQDVEIHVTFRNLQELTAVRTSGIKTPLTATIITEYVYLADPEINWFKKSQVDYIIQQCQYETFELPSQFTSSVLQLNFINPIRELFFIVELDNASPYPYNYSDLNSLGMTFNGYEAFTTDVTDNLYLNSIEPFNKYPSYPTRLFYMYAFANQANTPKPYGQINFSRIRNVFIQLNTNAYNSTKQFRVIGINYNILRVKNGLAGLMFNSNDI